MPCAIHGCEEPSGRRHGHPIHRDLCRNHGGDLYSFMLWLGSERLGGPDESFDSARAFWHREWELTGHP